MNSKNFSTLHMFQQFPLNCRFFSWVLSTTVFQVSLHLYGTTGERKPEKQKTTSRNKGLKQVSTVISGTNNFQKKRGDVPASQESLQLIKVSTDSVKNQLFWFWTVCARLASVYNNQTLIIPVFAEQELSKDQCGKIQAYDFDSLKK